MSSPFPCALLNLNTADHVGLCKIRREIRLVFTTKEKEVGNSRKNKII